MKITNKLLKEYIRSYTEEDLIDIIQAGQNFSSFISEFKENKELAIDKLERLIKLRSVV